MKHYILFLFALLPFLSFGQCIIEATERGTTVYVPIDEVAYVNPSGSGSVIVRQSGLRQINASEPLDTIVSRCSPSLFRFTNSSDGRLIAVSKTFIDRIVINGNGKAVVQTKNARIAYISFEDAEDLNVDILNCYGESKGETESPGNCIKTITQTAHGFSEGDVLFWDTDEYVNLEGNYTGAEVPLYVVTDSLTVNTFTAASCGEVDSDLGLADGLYYATDTGLELAPEDVEYPAVVVYGSKSKIVLNYGLEFDATGKPLFDIVTVTGQRTIEGGDTMDLHADSIRVSITIADTVATDVGHALKLLRNNSGGISGLTTNIIPKATSATGIGNGSITDDGTNIGIGTASPTSKIDVTTDNLGTTQTNSAGIGLVNNTAAADGLQQISPGLRWTGQGWKTNATAASQRVDFRADVLPVQGTANPTGQWRLMSSINGGAYSTVMNITESGFMRVSGQLGVGINSNINPLIWSVSTDGGIFDSGGRNLSFYSYNANNHSNVNAAAFNFIGSAFIATSGVQNTIRIGKHFTPTSGTATHAGLHIATTINQTGGANGITRGVHIEPTLTAAADFRAFEISSISGHWGLFDAASKHYLSGNLSVGTTSPSTSAKVQINSTTQGFLPPRMTGAQAEAIATPAEGLMVYATDGSGVTITTKGWWGYDGATWVKLN